MNSLNYLKKEEAKLWTAFQNSVTVFGTDHIATIRAQVRWATTKEHLTRIEEMIEQEYPDHSKIILQAERDAREQMDAMISAFGRQDHGTKRSIHEWYILDELIDKLEIERK